MTQGGVTPDELMPVDGRRNRIYRILFFVGVGGVLSTFFFGLYVYWQLSRGLPRIITLADYRPYGVTQILTVEDEKEHVIGEFYKERRYLLSFEEIPKQLSQAFIAAEDDQFFDHKGISLTAILRASIANFRAGHVVQGGSTITQQVAKSLFLTPERSFIRKIKEAILASRIETHLTKEQILFLYLNQIYLGHGAYGVEAASRAYFRKPAHEITLGEAALLAGLPRAPSAFSPFTNPSRAKQRQVYVLKRMFESGFVTEGEMLDAASKPVRIYPLEDVNLKYAPHLVEHVRRYLVEEYGEAAVYQEGLKVYVPSRRSLFEVASKSVRMGLREVDKRRGYRGPISRVDSEEEFQKFIAQQRELLIRKRVGYEVLLPDGRLGLAEAMQEAGFLSDRALLEAGQSYHAIVRSVDDGNKVANVMIGEVPVVLPMDELKWARPVSDGTGKTKPPAVPSDVVSTGDVILVKVLETSQEQVVHVALEQTPEVQGALLSIEAGTGNVLAMVGGDDYTKSEFNRATQAKRQSGSAFKPVIYTAAIEKGYTPATVIVDSPIVYKDDESGNWKPANFSERFYGDTTVRQALIMSRNIPTIKIVQDLQVPTVIRYARRLGMTGDFNEDLSISLGSGSTTLLELCSVYALYPRLGRKVEPIFIRKVVDRDGHVLEENLPQFVPDFSLQEDVAQVGATGATKVIRKVNPGHDGRIGSVGSEQAFFSDEHVNQDSLQILDPKVAYVMSRLMKDVVEYGTGRKARIPGRAVAGKTGTTSDYKDAWFVGFTPHVITGAWVGFDDQRSMPGSETGSGAALPIWVGYMEEAIKGYPDTDFPIPAGVVLASIDAQTGKLTAPDSVNARTAAFIEGTEPTESQSQGGDAVDTESEFIKEAYE